MPRSGQRFEHGNVRGFLHGPGDDPLGALVIAHGAGSNCEAPLLVAVADSFAAAGWLALRFDLPYRQARPKGPPLNSGKQDREGIRQAAAALREHALGCPMYLAGHSYGGRMCTMLAAEDPQVASALLLLSYPLHLPKQPANPRTEHFPALRVPAFFVHGTKDAFGSVEEMDTARQLIPARTRLMPVERAGHGLPAGIAGQIVQWFSFFVS